MPENCSWCNLVDCHGDGRWFCDALEDLVQIDDVRDPRCPLVEIPSEDIQPIKHCSNLNAAWSSLFECSICHWKSWDIYDNDTTGYNYCPNCGAKIDG